MSDNPDMFLLDGVSLSSDELADDDLLVCFRRILRSDAAASRNRQLYAAAEKELLSKGAQGVVPGIVAHFSKLFDVKRLEGVFPRMNVRATLPWLACPCVAMLTVCSPPHNCCVGAVLVRE